MIKSRQSKKKSKKISNPGTLFTISSALLVVVIIILSYFLFGKINQLIDQVEKNEIHFDSTKVIQVEVLNGCGTEGIADKFTDVLRTHKFDVVHTANYRSFDVDYSLVIDRSGDKDASARLANALGINQDQVIQQLNKKYFLDISIIIGKDFYNLNKQ